jgi:hypothetical protein
VTKVYNQKEAAQRLTDLGWPMHETELSKMGKYGAGPEFDKKSGRKIFTDKSLKDWLAIQRDNQNTNSAIAHNNGENQ